MEKEKEEKPNHKRFSPLYLDKKINIYTNKSTSILENNYYLPKYHDNFVTATELVFKYFTEKEIMIMRSDPGFFKLNKEVFKEVDIFKKKKLAEILDEDEKIKDIIRMRKVFVNKTSKYSLRE
jgi:hypothetical protein